MTFQKNSKNLLQNNSSHHLVQAGRQSIISISPELGSRTIDTRCGGGCTARKYAGSRTTASHSEHLAGGPNICELSAEHLLEDSEHLKSSIVPSSTLVIGKNIPSVMEQVIQPLCADTYPVSRKLRLFVHRTPKIHYESIT